MTFDLFVGGIVALAPALGLTIGSIRSELGTSAANKVLKIKLINQI
jgi:hypothetical protein